MDETAAKTSILKQKNSDLLFTYSTVPTSKSPGLSGSSSLSPTHSLVVYNLCMWLEGERNVGSQRIGPFAIDEKMFVPLKRPYIFFVVIIVIIIVVRKAMRRNGTHSWMKRRRWGRQQSETQLSSVWNKYIHLCIADQRAMLLECGGRTRQSFFGVDKETRRHQQPAKQINFKYQKHCDWVFSRWRASASASVVIFIVPIKRLFYLRATAKKLSFFCRSLPLRACHSE